MLKKIIVVFLCIFTRNISYAIDSTERTLYLDKKEAINNQLFIENNQGMLRVEIPRRPQYVDVVQGYFNVVNECKKECCNCNCNCNCTYNIGLCGVCCVSFVVLKCLLG